MWIYRKFKNMQQRIFSVPTVLLFRAKTDNF
jgi:hypothetical protein